MENPNLYNEERYNRAGVSLSSAVGELWEAGAELEDIEQQLADAFTDALGKPCSIEIGVAP